MTFSSSVARASQIASQGLIAATQVATRRGWVRGPSGAVSHVGQGAFRYRVERDHFGRDAAAFPIENAHEVAFDRTGRLYLLTDHPANNVLVFGLDGQLADAWTLGMTGAHGLTLVAEDGRECLWITDAYGGRVVKTTLAGELLWELPSPHAIGAYGTFEPYLPTQTAVAPNGDIYVADGYGSDYVLRFDAAGSYLGRFGGRGRHAGALRYAHGIAVDRRKGEARPTLLVTSRLASRFERFDLEGKPLGSIDLPGAFPCRPVLAGEYLYVGLCWSGAHLKPNSGFVAVLGPDDRVLATLGGHLDEHGRLASDYSLFTHVHDVAVAATGDLVACEWNAGGRAPVRLVREPAAAFA